MARKALHHTIGLVVAATVALMSTTTIKSTTANRVNRVMAFSTSTNSLLARNKNMMIRGKGNGILLLGQHRIRRRTHPHSRPLNPSWNWNSEFENVAFASSSVTCLNYVTRSLVSPRPLSCFGGDCRSNGRVLGGISYDLLSQRFLSRLDMSSSSKAPFDIPTKEDDDDDDDDDGDDDNEDEDAPLYGSLEEDDEDENEDDGEENQNEQDSTPESKPSSTIYISLKRSLQKSIKALTKKQNSLSKELAKAESLESTMYRANLILSNLYQLPPGTTRATVTDWETNNDIELVLDEDEYRTFQEEADGLFAAAKKMKRGSAVVGGLLEDVRLGLEILEEAMGDMEGYDRGDDDDDDNDGYYLLIRERLERTSKQTGFQFRSVDEGGSNGRTNTNQKRVPSTTTTRWQPTFRRFKSPSGCLILVGRNRRDNEALCFQVSRSEDIWMHARGCPGAHVLVQVRRGSPQPTDECLQYAANLAAFYSDARTERKAGITTAHAKHIQKPRGAPLGAVKVRQEMGTLVGCPADVPDELKELREESGVAWDEGGSRSLGGKAKNRKWTKEVARQNMAKKRAEKRANNKRNKRRTPSSSSDTGGASGGETDFY